MNTAVHGKASLAEMLLDDSTAAGKSGPDERDQTNTVDFGATLTSLIDQAAGKATLRGNLTTSAAASARSKRNADAPDAIDSGRANSPANPNPGTAVVPAVVDSTATVLIQDLSTLATTAKVGATSSAPARTSEAGAQTSSTRNDALAALINNRTLPTYQGEAEAGASSLQQINPSASNDAVDTSKASAHDANATCTSDGVSAGNPAAQSVVTTLVANSGAAATLIDSAVPDPDIRFDFRKELFSATASDGAVSGPSAPIAAANNFAKTAIPTHIDAEANPPTTSTNQAADSTPSHPDRASDGTSPALSTQGADTDTMSSSNSKPMPPSLANVTAKAATSSVAQLSLKQVEPAQGAPQSQRDRSANSKEASTQSTELSAPTNDSAAIADAPPAAPAPEAAAIRLTPEATSAPDASRNVSITVQLTSGQTARASVSEHAGTVDVKILTPTAASAQRVSSEMDGLRQNLDAAGIKLGHSEISYQSGDRGGQGREGYRPPGQQNQSANGKELFIMDEVIQ